MGNVNLAKAKSSKFDEFYTQYCDIEKEVNAYLEFNPNIFQNKVILCPCDDPEWSNFTKYFAQNFERFKLKKLISTSFAFKNKDGKGKHFILDKDINNDQKINIDDLNYKYLNGDGDFRSKEVTELRNEADFIITNPPFSLFREFLDWIMEAKKQFLIIGNVNNVTYKEVFPLIKKNMIWLGTKSTSKAMFFKTSDKEYASRVSSQKPEGSWWRKIDGEICIGINNSCWFTNLDHGRRHQPLSLMSLKDNLKFHNQMKKKKAYEKYDNYDAIEVPFTKAIPSDYEGKMGVPVSFLDKYNPEQFEIIGIDRYVKDNPHYGKRFTINNKEKYARILIKHRKIKD